MEEDDYEGLPSSCSMTDHMLAGACAGILEHSVMFPIDSVKTRMQCFSNRYGSVSRGLMEIIQTEGFARSLRGLGAMVSGAGPAHAMYFASYEYFKSYLADTHLGSFYLAPALSGVFATLMHDSIMTPADAIKQRLQMFRSPYSNSLDCIQRVLQAEGLPAFYRAFFTQLCMNIPYQSVHFVVYEAAQDTLNPNKTYQPWTHSVSGGLGGAVAAAITTPLDVCKTILNTQEQAVLQGKPGETKPISGLYNAASLIYAKDGFMGFTRGMNARILTSMPGAAISWSVYEYFKWYLRSRPSTPGGLVSHGNLGAATSGVLPKGVICASPPPIMEQKPVNPEHGL